MSTNKAKKSRVKKSEAKPKVEPSTPPVPGSGILTTGTAPGMMSADDPRQKDAERRSPVGIRPSTANQNTAKRVGKSKSIKALLYRAMEVIRNQTGHVKSPEYLELEKDLGFAPKP